MNGQEARLLGVVTGGLTCTVLFGTIARSVSILSDGNDALELLAIYVFLTFSGVDPDANPII
jgi:hypothetical protein